MEIVLGLVLFLVCSLIAASGPPPPTAGAMTLQFVPVAPPPMGSDVATWLLVLVGVLLVLSLVLP